MTPPVNDPAAADDATLVARTLRDPQAYGAIVLRFEAVLRRYVKRLLGQHGQAAEDVVQDVFIKAYVNLNDYDPARPLGPWLFRTQAAISRSWSGPKKWGFAAPAT